MPAGAVAASHSPAPVCHCAEALNPAGPSPSDVQAKIPHIVLIQSQSQARPEGTECRTRPCDRRNEATQSPLGLSANRCTDHLWPSTFHDEDVVRRILADHHWPGQSPGGPSWLTFLGHMKESLWSMDLFRCESVTLRTHWVLVVMDQYTRRIMGFGVHAGTVDGVALSRMISRGQSTSTPTMILSISSTNGKPICGSWR